MNKKPFRIMCHIICALSLLCAACSVWAQALDSGDFSVDNLSPEVPGPFNGKTWNASDILKFTGTDVLVLGSYLFPQGFPMSPFDESDAITTGQDRLMVPGPGFHLALEYSVGRNSLGLGGPVSRQRGLNGNGGDKFRLYLTPQGRRVGPFLESDAPNHNLTPLPQAESNLDGLSWPQGERSRSISA